MITSCNHGGKILPLQLGPQRDLEEMFRYVRSEFQKRLCNSATPGPGYHAQLQNWDDSVHSVGKVNFGAGA
jgi:hypothetical protein